MRRLASPKEWGGSVKRNASRLLEFALAREGPILLSLLAALLVAGALYSALLGDRLRYVDESDYHTLAQNLAHKGAFTQDGVQPSAIRPPGYPLFLAAFILFDAPVVFLRFLNFLALGGCLYLTRAILRGQSGAPAGLLGVGLVLGYPVLFYASGTLYPQIVGAFLLLAALHLLFNRDRDSLKPGILAGVCFGLLLLFIPSFIFTVAVLVAWTSVFGPRIRRKSVGAMLLTAGLFAGAWSIRNYHVFGVFFYGSANSGFMLLLGNSENTTPNAGPTTDISRYSGATGNDVEADSYYRARAVEYISANRVRTAQLYLLKALNYFNYRNDLATKSEASTARDLVMLFTYGPLLLLLSIRLLWVRRFPLSPFEWLILVLYVSNAFYAAVFFTRVRYRLPMDFLLIMLVASSLAQWLGTAPQELKGPPGGA